MKVAQKVAIVTGGGGGIGGALAERLAAEGARVVVADLDGAAASAVAEAINAERPGAAVSAGGDVSDETVIAGLIAQAEKEFGPVDLYFANAGVTGGMGLDISEDVWDTTIDVNVRAHIRAARLLVPGWTERGGGLLHQHGLCGRLAQSGRVRRVLGDQTCRGRVCRVALDHLRRSGCSRQLPVPDGRQHQASLRR